MSTSDKKLKSIFEMEPLEEGGPIARGGFTYQDHVAVTFVLHMIQDDALVEIFCESHDDITLIWKYGDQYIAEFIQVKSTELGQLWSVAELCKKDKSKKIPLSILDKSLQRDSCIECCKFRIITKMPVNGELEILKYEIGNDFRKPDTDEFKELLSSIVTKYGDFTSDKGNGVEHWLNNTLWQVSESLEAVKAKNYKLLDKVIESFDRSLLSDQKIEVYDWLLTKVKDASDCKWKPDPDKKKFKRAIFIQAFKEKVESLFIDSGSISATKLKSKMASAGLTTDVISTAVDLRREYSAALREQRYMDVGDHKKLLPVVQDVLQVLKTSMYSGLVEENAFFHNLCLAELNKLNASFNDDSVWRKPFLKGCMYDMTDRCQHRFNKE